MSSTPEAKSLICPRCRANNIEVRATSPQAGVWTVYGCDTCFYTWRNTEPEENTNPDKYPAVFRLSPENLSKLQIAPSIPPLRAKKA